MEKDLCRGLYMFCLIYTISKLHCAFSESRKCMPLHDTLVQSRDCVSTVNKCNGLTGWEHLSWLQKRVESSSSCWSLELGHSTGLGSLCAHTRPRGREFLRVGLVQGLECTCLTLMVTTELQELLTYVPYFYVRWKLERRPGFNCTCNRNCAILRLRTSAMRSWDWHAVSGFWDCTVQSWDCANS